MDIPQKIRNEVHRGRYSLEVCDILVAQSNQFQESEEIIHSPYSRPICRIPVSMLLLQGICASEMCYICTYDLLTCPFLTKTLYAFPNFFTFPTGHTIKWRAQSFPRNFQEVVNMQDMGPQQSIASLWLHVN
jgi:hypothetical protein